MKDIWYKNSYRRNLVDMHLEDWDPTFLSEFDPKEYCEDLKRAHIQSAMIYFHSHVGYSYYPTKTGRMHKGLVGREDAVRQLVNLCHENGIDVIGYYSLIFTTFEEDRHPEWRIMDGENDDSSLRSRGSRYGHCCPNNPEYRAYIREQIKEISEYFTVDGMFYDMTYWPGVCHCPACQKRLLEETGIKEIPRKLDFKDPAWLTFQNKRMEWIGEFARYVTACSKEFMPHASVEQNYAYGANGDWRQASSELVSDACDYCGGDLYGDIYRHSFVAKYYRAVSQNQPFEYMISRCTPNLGQHTINKTEEEMAMQVFLTAAHHGASFIIDAMDPVGTIDSRVYDTIGRIFEKQIPYEPYFKGTPIEDVAVYYSASGRYNTEDQEFDTRVCSIGLVKTLVSCHVPVGILANNIVSRMPNYQMVFAPAIAGLADGARKAILDYVKNGGVLYFSGTQEPLLLQEFFGAVCEGYTDTKHTYLAPVKDFEALFNGFNEKYPMATKFRLPLMRVDKDGVTVAAHLAVPYEDPADASRYASIHSNPPAPPTDRPVMLFTDYGKGKVVWCAAAVEHDERYPFRMLMMNLLHRYLPIEKQTVSSNAPHQVELCSYRTEEGYQINAVDLKFDDERLTVQPFDVSIRLDDGEEIESVRVLPNGETLDYRFEDGVLTFRTLPLIMYTMVGVKIKKQNKKGGKTK